LPDPDTLNGHGLCTSDPWLYEITAPRAWNDGRERPLMAMAFAVT
jgi:hypothetical protein